ncbi:MAG: sensor histidine kinase [Vicinamibacteria bacterium]
MTLRPKSFTARLAVANCAILAAALIFNSAYLSLSNSHVLRDQLTTHANAFARLSTAPTWRVFLSSEAARDARLPDMLSGYRQLESALERVAIVRGDEVVFDTDRARPGVWPEAYPLSTDRTLQQAATVTAFDSKLLREPGRGFLLEAASPVIDAAGRREAVVYFRFTLSGLDEAVAAALATSASLALVSLAVVAFVSLALASRLTKPIQQLTRGALAVGEGRFDRPLEVSGSGELRLLAETFNQMAVKLKDNVAQLEETNRRLAAANEELKELDRMKSDLLANVSHELRTPLTAIKGYAEYILDGKLGPVSEKQEKGLVVIQRNLDRLSRSISALLDFSTMDVGRISLNLQPFALPGLVEQIHQTLRSELDRKQVRFVSQVEPGLPPVIADREKLAQVLENLVVNAIKFTPAGGTIALSAARDPVAPATAEVAVRDTGIGIPRDQLARIFNRFHQVDSSTTRRFGGVGLGLAIVRSILEAHGAGISVDSEEGRGTEFRFRLPLLGRDEAHPPGLPGYS